MSTREDNNMSTTTTTPAAAAAIADEAPAEQPGGAPSTEQVGPQVLSAASPPAGSGESYEDFDEGADPRLSKVRNEARGLRGRLKVAESERDELRGQVEQLRRQQVRSMAVGRGRLADGEDLFRAGIEVPSLLAEDGSVDAERVEAAVSGVLAEHPHWQYAPPNFDMPKPLDQLRGGATPGRVDSQGKTWHDVIGG